jgi:Inner membrane component of T3SS, cytoplasmic domain
MGGDVWTFLGSSGAGNDDFELLQAVPLRAGVIGSDESCELRLHDPLITARHARMVHQDGRWFVGGIAMASPTLINGAPTLPGQALQLSDGDVVTMGTARFRLGAEPPPRTGVDRHDPTALSKWADQLAESGDSLGEYVLERATRPRSWFPGDYDESLELEWEDELPIGLHLRGASLGHLQSLCRSSLGELLERLTIFVSEYRDEVGSAREVMQILALTKPPRLRHLRFGWLHSDAPLEGLARDWAAVARRVPLEGSAPAAFTRAGTPRFTMLWSAPWWPAAGVTTSVPVGTLNFFRPEADSWVSIGRTATNATRLFVRHEVRLNGAKMQVRHLVHGDVVEGQHFSFRFEED